MANLKQAQDAIEKNEAAKGSKEDKNAAGLVASEAQAMTGAGTGFESKEEKAHKDDNIARSEPQNNGFVVDASKASEPVKILQDHGIEVQREENGLYSTKRIDDTILLGGNLNSFDATKVASRNLLDASVDEIIKNVTRWEQTATKAQDYSSAARFAAVANGLPGLVAALRSLNASDISYIEDSEAQARPVNELPEGTEVIENTHENQK